MMKNRTIAVIGGDLRQVHLAGLLSAEGFTVFSVGLDRDTELAAGVQKYASAEEAVKKAECVILPLPYSVDGDNVNAPFARTPIPLDEIWDAADSSKLIIGGKFSEKVRDLSRRHNFMLVDYYEREELAILNTIPTAEGAIQIALEELPITIYNANCLVMGFGRVAKTLARDLFALGAKVSVCARKYADLAWIQVLGYRPIHISKIGEDIGRYDVIFNTIPAKVLNEGLLSSLKHGCLVIDLASKPGGVDFETAGRLGTKTVLALSLPGKVAPITSGAMMKDTIMNILSEEGSK